MFFYLKKFWKVNLLAVLFQMFQNSGRVIWSLLMILLFQQVIELNFKGVVFFCVIELVVSGGRNVCSSLSSYFQSEAIRRMNDQLRQDMAASLLNKSYKEYHLQENGAYLSQFTNDVNQIEQAGMEEFLHSSWPGCGSGSQCLGIGCSALVNFTWCTFYRCCDDLVAEIV